jgi:hypothetical protein
MGLPSSHGRSVTRVVLLLLWVVFWISPLDVVAQEEASPITIELLAPQEAGPGQVIDIRIQYDVIDPNAGAEIIYNLIGPGHILAREPEPPNPIVNIWAPGREMPTGTIKVQVRANEDAEGQRLGHLVEVRWGAKVHRFEAETLIKYVPPTATPTYTPRPQASPTTPPEPTTSPAAPTVRLTDAAILTADGSVPISTAEANEEIAFQATYVSSGPAEDVTALVRFEPDVVNLDGMPWGEGGYALQLGTLAAAPGGADLFTMPLQGRIRPWSEGGEHYKLRAVIQLRVPDTVTDNSPDQVPSQVVDVAQSMRLIVNASAEAEVVRAGGSIIVHTRGTNLGSVPVEQLKFQIAGLPEGYLVSPGQQVIDHVAADGGSEERVFTIRVPEDGDERLTFRVAATLSGQVIESQPMTVRIVPPASLDLQVSAERLAVRAGETLYVEVVCTNDGFLIAEDVEAKLIDTTGNLGVLLQRFGDVGPGESIHRVFAVTVQEDFPTDVVSSLVVRTTSKNGAFAESSPLVVEVSCVPQYEIVVQPPLGQMEGGQSVETAVILRNVSQCTARDVLLSVEGLPKGFVVPPAQELAELAPGSARHLNFNLLIPEGYRGDVSFTVVGGDGAGTQLRAAPSSFTVRGVSTVFTIVFGALFLLALSAIIGGVVLYFRHR